MAGFIKDLSQLTGQLASARQEMSQIEGVANSMATAMKRVGDTFGNAFGKTNATGGNQSPLSQKAGADFATAQNPEHYAVMQDFQKNGFNRAQSHTAGYVLSDQGQLLKRQTDGTGASSFAPTDYSIQKFTQAQNNFRQSIARFHGEDSPSAANLAKYGSKDIPRLNNLSDNKNLPSALDKQAKSFARGDFQSQETSKLLTTLSDRIKTQQTEYKSALTNFAGTSNGDEAKKAAATEALVRVMASLERTISEANEASRSAGPSGPPNGPLGAAGSWLRANPGKALAGVAAAGLGAYEAYNHLSLAYQNANLGGNNQAYINQSALRGAQLGRQADYYDVSSPGSFLKNRGDILLGKDAPFLGGDGFQRATKNAQKEENARLDIVRQERNAGFWGRIGAGALAGASSGAAIGALGAGIGAIPGAIAGGFVGSIGGLISGGSSYLSSEATAQDGGLFGFMNGSEAQNKARTQSQLNVQSRAEQLRNANLAAESRTERGLGGILDMYTAQQQGALSVGRYAMTKDRLMEIVNDVPAATIQARAVATADFTANNPIDKAAIRKAIIANESGGNYSAVNPTTGAMGAFQIMPKGAFMRLAASKYGLSKDDMISDKMAQDSFFSKEMMPEYINSAKSMQKRIPQAAAMDINVLTGLMQLGSGNVETYLKTGVDKTGGQIQPYIKGLQKSLGSSGGGALAAAPSFDDADAVFNNDLKRQSFFAKNQISYSEFAGKFNALSNVVGRGSSQNDLFQRSLGKGNSVTGLTTLEGQTAGLISLERGGLGDFQSNVGNIAALNKVNGSDNNYKALEGILGNAVAVGFDKSRMAQTFVRTTTELTQAIGSTNTDYVGATLGKQAGAFSIDGKANEMSLGQANAAIQQYAQITNGSGIVGIGKNLGAQNSGATLSGGAGLIASMNSAQSMGIIHDLESGRNTSLEGNALVDETMRTKSVSRAEAMKIAATQLRSSVQGGNSIILGTMDLQKNGFITSSKNKLVALAKAGKEGSTEYKTLFEQLKSASISAGASTSYGALGGFEAVLTDLQAAGGITAKSSTAALEKAKKQGNDLFADPIKVQYQAFIDSAVRETAGKTKGIGVAEYVATASTGAQDMKFTSGANAGHTIDSQKLADIQKKKDSGAKLSASEQSYYDNAEKDLKGTDRIERARSASIAKSETSTAQRVIVDNFDYLVTSLIPTNGARNLKGAAHN